jgi:hypothetical protein
LGYAQLRDHENGRSEQTDCPDDATAGPQKYTIPDGAPPTDVTEERDSRRFFYLGEPYEWPNAEIETALREVS